MHGIAQPAALPLVSIEPWLALARRSVPGAVSRNVAANAVVAQTGQRAAVFLVESGVLVLMAATGAGRCSLVAAVGAGEVFGEESLSAFVSGLSADDVRACSGARPWGPFQPEARALGPARVLSMPAEGLRWACLRDPILAAGLSWRLADAAQRMGRRLAATLSMPVAGRVAGALWELARVGGRRTPIGVRIELPVTQELLGSLAGATRESVNRALRTLASEGCIRRVGRTYVLPPEPDHGLLGRPR
jgi:CRP/FNR family transcriptional regulator, cyclic AMP receptor protein